MTIARWSVVYQSETSLCVPLHHHRINKTRKDTPVTTSIRIRVCLGGCWWPVTALGVPRPCLPKRSDWLDGQVIMPVGIWYDGGLRVTHLSINPSSIIWIHTHCNYTCKTSCLKQTHFRRNTMDMENQLLSVTWIYMICLCTLLCYSTKPKPKGASFSQRLQNVFATGFEAENQWNFPSNV